MKKLVFKLTGHEPIIDFFIQPTSAFQHARKAAGLPQAEPIPVKGLIDTGFTGGLFIDAPLIKGWGLKIRNFNRVSLPQEEAGRYFESYAWEADLAIRFKKTASDGENILVDPIPATLVEFCSSGDSQALLGQEILQACTFLYHGPKKYFSIAFSDSFRVS